MTAINPISETAYYCCGARALDADSTNSLLNDHYAHRFLDDHGLKIFSSFRNFRNPNMSSVVRSLIIEDQIKELLAHDKNTQVVLVGAGFDSKAFRILGGRWAEIDEQSIIDFKNTHLPFSECQNNLIRIAVDFQKGELSNALAKLDSTLTTLFIVEGVLMYLNDNEIDAMLSAFKKQFKNHQVIADLMSSTFIERQMGRFLKELSRFGCRFKFFHKYPTQFFKDRGYQVEFETSIIGRAKELGRFQVPWIILKTFYVHVLNGYSVGRFSFVDQSQKTS